jgi:transposase InsO family protein
VCEAAEVADLCEQTEGGVSRDAAEAAQPRNRIGPRLVGCDLLELVVKRSDLAIETSEVGEHVLERAVCERIVQALGLDPRTVALGPRPAIAVDVPVAQAHWPRDGASDHRARALPHWLEHYNTRRPHSGIGDRPPISRVHNLCGQDT